jgi:hypothetical protein
LQYSSPLHPIRLGTARRIPVPAGIQILVAKLFPVAIERIIRALRRILMIAGVEVFVTEFSPLQYKPSSLQVGTPR